MTWTSFPIAVNHTQVLAYVTGTDGPGLLWTDDHVAQGFAWHDGIACFGVPDHDGMCLIEVDTEASAPDLAVEASLWAIEVPFEATASTVQVGTILDDRPVSIVQGQHRLVFEAHAASDNQAFRLRFCFIPSGTTRFAILKQGPGQSGQVRTTTAARG